MDNMKDSDFGKAILSSLKQMNDKFDAMRQEVGAIRREVQTLKQSTEQNSNGRNPAPDMLSHYLEQQTNVSSNGDMSDTASTISIGSTGSEHESIKTDTFQTKCLAEAFQRKYVDVVRNIPFEHIVDEVVANQMVTIVESKCARDFALNDDGMRYLVRTLMDKDYSTMMKFVQLIGRYAPELKVSIMNIFRERCAEGRTYAKFCTACLVRDRVNIKHMCDYFFINGLITSGLHKDVTHLPSANATTGIWQRICKELSSKPTDFVLIILKDALKDGEGDEISHYADIIRSIDRDIQRHMRSFKCRCGASSSRPITSANRLTATGQAGSVRQSITRRITGRSLESVLGQPLPHIQDEMPSFYGRSLRRTSLLAGRGAQNRFVPYVRTVNDLTHNAASTSAFEQHIMNSLAYFR